MGIAQKNNVHQSQEKKEHSVQHDQWPKFLRLFTFRHCFIFLDVCNGRAVLFLDE